MNDTCKRCGLGKETREHLLFHCAESTLIWKIAPLSWDGIQSSSCSFEEWWMSLWLANKDPHFVERMEVSVYLLWFIWKARCAWKFEGLKWEAMDVVQKAVNEWQEFKAAENKPAARSRSMGKGAVRKDGGQTGVQEIVKINLACEVQERSRRVGLDAFSAMSKMRCYIRTPRFNSSTSIHV